ncbi:MAG TPA: peptidoglycan DD-metalloendopeptidase family protein [Bacillales bacterium]|nr:peptidoglycan DD-metalloendopeptidase family protein [Bacillales bacterium]
MSDFLKRLMIAFVFMILIGIMIIGSKAIHADTPSGWEWPVNGIMTSSFGDRGGEHKGIDIAAPMGTPVVAAKSGVVKRSYHSSSYGNVVFILHSNGDETVYAHLKERLVNKGDVVKQGQEIGEVGSTGDSTGPHLHFEIHHGLWNVDKTHAFNPLLVLGSKQSDGVVKVSSSKKSDTVKAAKPQADGNQQALKEARDNGEEVSVSSESIRSNPVELLEFSKDDTDKRTLTVKKGDTLWGLAHQYNVPVSSIKKWNHLSSDMLQIGQSLVIYPNLLKTYHVKSGDTLDAIAASAGISVTSLIHLNHLQGQNIYPSEILITGMDG